MPIEATQDVENIANDVGGENEQPSIGKTARNRKTLHSSFIRDPDKYEPRLQGLIHKLSKREQRFGRYNPITSLAYGTLGNAYHNRQQTRAVAMYRTEYRIEVILYGGSIKGPIAGAFLQALQERQLSSSIIESIQNDIQLSTRHELEGDWFRRYGRRQQALTEYHAAARIEESSFGRDNPDLTFLWRKMACLSAINRRLDSHADVNLLLDFEKADRIGNEWMSEARTFLSSSICSLIRRGDEYCCMSMYTHAIGEYFKASSGALATISHHHESSSTDTGQESRGSGVDRGNRDQPQNGSIGETRRESRKNSSKIEKNDMMLAGKASQLGSMEIGVSSSGTEKLQDSGNEDSNAPPNSEPYPKWKSVLSVKSTMVSDQRNSHSSSAPQPQNGQPDNSTLHQSQYPSGKVGEPEPTGKFEMSLKQPKRFTNARLPRRAKLESSILISLRRSTQSLMGHLEKIDECPTSPVATRPKSDSYLSKIRRRSKKMASKFPNHITKSSKKKVHRGESSSAIDGQSSAGISSYLMMASPPTTPFHSSEKEAVYGREQGRSSEVVDMLAPSISFGDAPGEYR
jgi:hypothetical protein